MLKSFGETNETIIALDELTAISQKAAVQISRLLLRTAEIQPVITPDMLELLTDRITKIEDRVPALERSVQEIKTDWGLL